MKIYKYEKREWSGNQHSYDTRVTHTRHYLHNTRENRIVFAVVSGMNGADFDNFVNQVEGNYSIEEIEVIE